MFIAIPPLDIGRRNMWVLSAPLVYKSVLFDLAIHVPAGFETDLASIPVGFRNLINVNGTHRAAAIVHDYLYAIRGRHVRARLSRGDCDAIFKEAMAVSGVGRLKRNLMYSAVRAGGWLFW